MQQILNMNEGKIFGQLGMRIALLFAWCFLNGMSCLACTWAAVPACTGYLPFYVLSSPREESQQFLTPPLSAACFEQCSTLECTFNASQAAHQTKSHAWLALQGLPRLTYSALRAAF